MNPNVQLEEIRTKVRTLFAHYSLSDEEIINTGLELAELLNALDNWISTGGFLPTAWKPTA